MEAVKDLIGSIRIGLSDRIQNPLFGYFIISWVVWNFRLVMIIFSDGPWLEKIEYIDKRLMVTAVDWFLHGVLVPGISCIFWVFAFPWISRKTIVFYREAQMTTARAVMVVQDHEPLDETDATRIRIMLREANLLWQSERAEYLKSIEELQERVRNKSAETKGVEVEKEVLEIPGESIADKYIALGDVGPESTDIILQTYNRDLLLQKQVDEVILKDGRAELPSSVRDVLPPEGFAPEFVGVLLAIRNSDVMRIDNIAKATGKERIDVRVLLEGLKERSLVMENQRSGGVMLTAKGRTFVFWLKRKIEALL